MIPLLAFTDRDGMRMLFAQALDDAIEYLVSTKAIRYKALLKSEIAVVLNDQQGSGPSIEKNRQQLSILTTKREDKSYIQHNFVGQDCYDASGSVIMINLRSHNLAIVCKSLEPLPTL